MRCDGSGIAVDDFGHGSSVVLVCLPLSVVISCVEEFSPPRVGVLDGMVPLEEISQQ